MYFIELLRQIFHHMNSHRLQTFLSLFGVIWGTMAVILLLSLGEGFYNKSKADLKMLTNGTVIIWASQTAESYRGYPAGRKIHLRSTDIEILSQSLPQIAFVTPVYSNRTPMTVSYQQHQISPAIVGVGNHFENVNRLALETGGRSISSLDLFRHQNVIIINKKMKELLFGNQPALEKIIKINGINFTVIGVDTTDHTCGFSWAPTCGIIPEGSYRLLKGDEDISYVYIQPNNVTDSQALKENIYHLLASQHHFSPSDHSAIQIPNFEDTAAFVHWFFLLIRSFLGLCGFLTLAVGGISVANMMFLIVQQRSKEIGLQLALGARDFHIMSQVILEAVVLVMGGGVIGFLIAITIIHTLNKLTLPEWLGHPELSWSVTWITIGILIIVALLAGYFPARKAANHAPIEALKL